MNKQKIAGIGLNGLVGSRVIEFLDDRYEFEGLSRSTGVDITDKNSILDALKHSDASIVFHLAAKTDVDGCEKDKPLGEDGEAWQINVVGTQNVVAACDQTGKKLVYVSTDFVFDGENTPKDGYTESDTQNPVDWYGMTKYEGEKAVLQSRIPWIIMRLAYPYRAEFTKKDFIRVVLERLSQGQKLSMVTDHIMCPTFIDDFANAFDTLIKKEQTGIFHTVGSQAVSPFEAAQIVANVFDLDSSLIGSTTRAEFFKDRAKRPFNLTLKNARIEPLGIRMKSVEEGAQEIKNQIHNLNLKNIKI